MKNENLWTETKYEWHKGALRGSRNREHLARSSRISADAAAEYIQGQVDIICGDLADLGCGTVPLYEVYKARADTITCIDWGESKHDLQYADILCDLNEAIPIGDESFDTVVLTDVLEHIGNPANLISEISRMLRPGGTLLATVPFVYPLHEQPYDFTRFTRYGLEKILTETGFSEIQITNIGEPARVVLDIFAKGLDVAPRPFDQLVYLPVAIAQTLNATGISNLINTKFGDVMPQAYGVQAVKTRR